MEFKRSRLDSSLVEEGPDSRALGTPTSSVASSMGTPYRGPYSSSRSSLGHARYTPYSVSRSAPGRRSVPCVRVRKSDDPPTAMGQSAGASWANSSFGSLSPTAQRILNTLSAISSPVCDAKRVRLDAIKSVKPLGMGAPSSGTYLSASSRLCGPPKTTSPLLLPKSQENSSLCKRITAKMVDTGTNTDDYLILNYKSQLEKKHGDGSNSAFDLFSSSPSDSGKYKLNEKQFIFSKPWTIEEYELSRKSKNVACKVVTKNTNDDYQLHKIPNGNAHHDEILEHSGNPHFTPVGRKFASPNKNRTTDPEPIVPTKPVTPTVITNVSSSKWECPTCMVQNKESDNHCVCCTTENPNLSKKSSSETTDNSKPAAPIMAKWNCPTCMVPNDAKAEKCVCCSEKNPNAATESSDQTQITSTLASTPFSFGFKSTTSDLTSPKSNTVEKDKTASPKSTFSFGFSSSTEKTPGLTSNSGFSFGFKPDAQTESTTVISTKENCTDVKDKPVKETIRQSPKSDNLSSLTENKKELWECVICRQENKFELLKCSMCSSPKPHQAPSQNIMKTDTTSKPGLKFAPVFRKKDSDSSTTLNPSNSLDKFKSNSVFSNTHSNFNFKPGNNSSGGTLFGGTSSVDSPSVSLTPTPASSVSLSLPSSVTASNTATTSTTNSTQPTISASPFTFGTSHTSPVGKRKSVDMTDGPCSDVKKIAPTSFDSSPVSSSATSDPPNSQAPLGFLEALKNASAAVKASSKSNSLPTPSISMNSVKEPNEGQSVIPVVPAPAPTPLFQFGSTGNTSTGFPSAPTVESKPLAQPIVAENKPFTFGSNDTGTSAKVGFPSLTATTTASFTFGSANSTTFPSNSNSSGFNFSGSSLGASSSTPAAVPSALPPSQTNDPPNLFQPPVNSNQGFNFAAAATQPAFNFGMSNNKNNAGVFQFSSNAQGQNSALGVTNQPASNQPTFNFGAAANSNPSTQVPPAPANPSMSNPFSLTGGTPNPINAVPGSFSVGAPPTERRKLKPVRRHR